MLYPVCARLPDIARRRLSEHSAILAREVRDALVTNAIGRIADRLSLRQHPTAGLDEPKLLLKLQRRQRCDTAEVNVEG